MRALGLDGSKWIPEFNYKGNIDYFIQRLSYALITDERYEQRKEEIKDVPVKEGYHFYYMTKPWTAQVDKMLQLGDGYNAIWWDAEELTVNGEVINYFCDRFANETAEALRILQMENEKNGLYCNRDMYYLLESKLGASWLNGIPLWIADPHDNLSEDVFRQETQQPTWGVWRKNSENNWYLRKFDRPENTWTHWQIKFNGDPDYYGVVGKEAVDVNVFNGTFDDLLKYSGIEKNEGCSSLLKGVIENVKKLAN